jgi:tetratricopeptide (TPR) repeat protein
MKWVVSVLVVVGLVRFATTGTDGPAPSPPPAPRRDTAGVVADLEQATTRDARDSRAWLRLGAAYLRRATETSDPAFYGLSRRALDRAAALGPEDADLAITDGALRLALHDFAGALDAGRRAAAARPESADALAVVVDSLVELGRYDEAAATLQRLVDLRPNLAALARVSYLRELHGDVDGALAAMQDAETAGSGQPFDLAIVVAFEGDVRFSHGDVDGAAAAYQRALRVRPGILAARIGSARVAAARGDRAVAIRTLRAVTDRVPRLDAVLLLGDLEGAGTSSYEVARTIARLQQANGVTLDLELALFEADQGRDPIAALDLARRAHAARATVHAADAVAWALHRNGDDKGAVPYVEEAARLGTADALLHFHAAAIYAGVGDVVRARVELARVLVSNRWFSFFLQPELEALAGHLGVPL